MKQEINKLKQYFINKLSNNNPTKEDLFNAFCILQENITNNICDEIIKMVEDIEEKIARYGKNGVFLKNLKELNAKIKVIKY